MFYIVVESPDHCTWLAGNFQSKVLIETKESDVKGETTVIQNRTQASKSSSIFSVCGNHRLRASPASFVPSVGGLNLVGSPADLMSNSVGYQLI